MRLNRGEIDSIKSAIYQIDSGARIFLFGSRVRDNAAGGDIDLLVESQIIQFDDRISILAAIKKNLGEQKIDLIVTKDLANDSDPFIQSIKDEMKKI